MNTVNDHKALMLNIEKDQPAMNINSTLDKFGMLDNMNML